MNKHRKLEVLFFWCNLPQEAIQRKTECYLLYGTSRCYSFVVSHVHFSICMNTMTAHARWESQDTNAPGITSTQFTKLKPKARKSSPVLNFLLSQDLTQNGYTEPFLPTRRRNEPQHLNYCLCLNCSQLAKYCHM